MDILAIPFIILTAVLFVKRNKSRNLKIAFRVSAATTIVILVVLTVLTIALLQEGFPG